MLIISIGFEIQLAGRYLRNDPDWAVLCDDEVAAPVGRIIAYRYDYDIADDEPCEDRDIAIILADNDVIEEGATPKRLGPWELPRRRS
jgi:hypothetical protein